MFSVIWREKIVTFLYFSQSRKKVLAKWLSPAQESKEGTHNKLYPLENDTNMFTSGVGQQIFIILLTSPKVVEQDCGTRLMPMQCSETSGEGWITVHSVQGSICPWYRSAGRVPSAPDRDPPVHAVPPGSLLYTTVLMLIGISSSDPAITPWDPPQLQPTHPQSCIYY